MGLSDFPGRRVLALTSLPLVVEPPQPGISHVSCLPLSACRRPYPGGPAARFVLPRQRFCLPHGSSGSASPLRFSRLAKRSRLLRPTNSRNRLPILSTEGFDRFIASTATSVATD